MKLIISLFLVFCFNAFGYAQSSMTKPQRWENAKFRVRKEHHQLKRLEILTDSNVIDENLFKTIKLELLGKEGVVDLARIDAKTIRVYYLNFVPLDYVETMLNAILTNYSLENIIQLSFDSEEVQEVKG